MDLLPSDAPSARLCHLIKWPDFDGYGFNLHAEKAKMGQFIGKVDLDSPAQMAGLREGDRIIEVNGVNISTENHRQVVERIKSHPKETKLLVVDHEADEWYKQNDLVVKSTQLNVIYIKTPVPRPSSDSPRAQHHSQAPNSSSNNNNSNLSHSVGHSQNNQLVTTSHQEPDTGVISKSPPEQQQHQQHQQEASTEPTTTIAIVHRDHQHHQHHQMSSPVHDDAMITATQIDNNSSMPLDCASPLDNQQQQQQQQQQRQVSNSSTYDHDDDTLDTTTLHNNCANYNSTDCAPAAAAADIANEDLQKINTDSSANVDQHQHHHHHHHHHDDYQQQDADSMMNPSHLIHSPPLLNTDGNTTTTTTTTTSSSIRANNNNQSAINGHQSPILSEPTLSNMSSLSISHSSDNNDADVIEQHESDVVIIQNSILKNDKKLRNNSAESSVSTTPDCSESNMSQSPVVRPDSTMSTQSHDSIMTGDDNSMANSIGHQSINDIKTMDNGTLKGSTVSSKASIINNGNNNNNNNNNSVNFMDCLNLNMTASEMRELISRRKKFDPKKAQMNIRQKYEIIQQM